MSLVKYYLALCQGCAPILPQPFTDWDELTRWVKGHHDAVGHSIAISSVMLEDEESEYREGH